MNNAVVLTTKSRSVALFLDGYLPFKQKPWLLFTFSHIPQRPLNGGKQPGTFILHTELKYPYIKMYCEICANGRDK